MLDIGSTDPRHSHRSQQNDRTALQSREHSVVGLVARGKRGQTLSGQTISKSNRLPSKGSDPFCHGLLETAVGLGYENLAWKASWWKRRIENQNGERSGFMSGSLTRQHGLAVRLHVVVRLKVVTCVELNRCVTWCSWRGFSRATRLATSAFLAARFGTATGRRGSRAELQLGITLSGPKTVRLEPHPPGIGVSADVALKWRFSPEFCNRCIDRYFCTKRR